MSCPKGTSKICRYEGAIDCGKENCTRMQMGFGGIKYKHKVKNYIGHGKRWDYKYNHERGKR